MSSIDPQDIPENTDAQNAFHAAREAAWEEEKTWPLWEVRLTGDPAVFAPRADERYWNYNEANGAWEPKPADELPDDAAIDPETGGVVREAYGIVTCHARSEDHAKMLAMRDNPHLHTIEYAKELETSE